MARTPIPPAGVPAGRVLALPGRGEVFFRHHSGGAPDAPTLLLLHGWTASADLQWFSSYGALAERYSFVAIDHRGHGRGLRSDEPFTLEAAADDAAALVRALGLSQVVPVGFSMGGPIALELWRRHRELVSAMVLSSTAMTFSRSRRDRALRHTLPLLETAVRSRLAHRMAMGWARRQAHHRRAPEMVAALPWFVAEMRRADPAAYSQAARALSRYDGSYASGVDVPAAMVITTRDRLVAPALQRQLAIAVRAEVVELAGDHLCTWYQPQEFAAVLRRAVDGVADRLTPSVPSASTVSTTAPSVIG